MKRTLLRTIGSGGTGIVLLAFSLGALDAQAAEPCMAPTPACAKLLPPPPPPKREAPPADGPFMKAKKREAFLTLYAQTAHCMRSASLAAMRYGTEDRKDVVEFSVGMCGEGLRGWLLREEKYTEKKADALLNAMGHKALDTAIRGPNAIIIR